MRSGIFFAMAIVGGCTPTTPPASVSVGLPLSIAAASGRVDRAEPSPSKRAHREPLCVSTGPRPASPPPGATCCYLPQSTMREAVTAHADRYQACYETALARDPTLAGRIAARFTVDHDGHVRTACEARDEERAGDIDDPALVDCVLRALTTVTFAPFAEVCPTMEIVYPLAFTPR